MIAGSKFFLKVFHSSGFHASIFILWDFYCGNPAVTVVFGLKIRVRFIKEKTASPLGENLISCVHKIAANTLPLPSLAQ
jgi:hypothetical protein